MAQQVLQNETAKFSTSYRAVCTKGDYTGSKRATKNEAIRDASKHRSKPGKEDHVIDIVVSQSFRLRFVEEIE